MQSRRYGQLNSLHLNIMYITQSILFWLVRLGSGDENQFDLL